MTLVWYEPSHQDKCSTYSPGAGLALKSIRLFIQAVYQRGHVESIEEQTHAFIVRFWLEPREIENARPIWRGVVEHVDSGSKLYLKNLEEVKQFITSYLPEIKVIN